MNNRSYEAALRRAKEHGYTSYINNFGFQIDIDESLEMLAEECEMDENEHYLLIGNVIIAYEDTVDENAEVFGFCE